ncbi:MAG: nicotinate-nucleotide adenylyltransferase [Gemmataceae bacterium]
MTPNHESHDLGVIHGRFQVLHNDHLKYLLAGKEQCRHLVVGITNAETDMIQQEAADPERGTRLANPLTYFERYQLVRYALLEAGVDHQELTIVPFPISHPERYCHYVPLGAVFFLTIYDDWGRRKQEYFESLGLRTCILREVQPEEKGISATDVRQHMLQGTPWQHLVPKSVAKLLEGWNVIQRLQDIRSELGTTPPDDHQTNAS